MELDVKPFNNQCVFCIMIMFFFLLLVKSLAFYVAWNVVLNNVVNCISPISFCKSFVLMMMWMIMTKLKVKLADKQF